MTLCGIRIFGINVGQKRHTFKAERALFYNVNVGRQNLQCWMLLFRFRVLGTLVAVMRCDVFQFHVFLPMSCAPIRSRRPRAGSDTLQIRFFYHMVVILESLFIWETCVLAEKFIRGWIGTQQRCSLQKLLMPTCDSYLCYINYVLIIVLNIFYCLVVVVELSNGLSSIDQPVKSGKIVFKL